MTTESLYIPHHRGEVLGAPHLAPWVADELTQATTHDWHGQPVFRDRTAAFGWLDWAQDGRLSLLDRSIAHVSGETSARPGDVVRIRFDPAALLDPANQIARGTPHADSPHPSVLASWYATTRAAAGTRWVAAAPGTVPARSWITDLATTVWNHAYPLASRDARTTVAGRVADAANAAVRTLLTGGDRQAQQGLVRLRRIAEQAAASAVVPAVAERTIAAATDAAGSDTDRHGWQRAVDRVWADALTAGAHDTVLRTSMNIYAAWLAEAQPFDDTARVDNRDLPDWILATLADTNRAIAKQWRTAAAGTPPPRAPHARANPWPGQSVPDEAVAAHRHPPGSSTDPPAADLQARTGKAFTPLAVLPPTHPSPPGPMPPPDSTTPQRGRSR